MAPLKKRSRPINPGKVTGIGSSQQQVIAEAAAKYHISGQTLWGVYGTESSYGTDPSTSSAGAQGPFQFIPSTAAEYGLNPQTVMQLKPAAFASARYLHNLGADANPNSGATRAALNGYNGNGGGSSETSYTRSVLEKGRTFAASAPSDVQETPPATPENQGGTVDASLLGGVTGTLGDILTGDLSDLASKLSVVGLHLAKDFGIGFINLFIAPAWHWNQRVVAYYSHVVLDPKRIGDRSEFQWAFAWTAGLWGFGYVLLYTEAENGVKETVPPHRSRLARHIRKAQSIPARQALVKPRDVKGHTPDKPPPKTSHVKVTKIDTMSTTRPRTVKVTHASGSPLAPEPAPQAHVSRVEVQDDGTIKPVPAKPDTAHNARQRASEGSRVHPKGSPPKGRKTRHRPRHR